MEILLPGFQMELTFSSYFKNHIRNVEQRTMSAYKRYFDKKAILSIGLNTFLFPSIFFSRASTTIQYNTLYCS
jgi:hypothetical protein